MQEFKLDGLEFIALCDLLKRVGLCENGGHAKAVIAEGNVKVNNLVELRKRCKIREGNLVEYENEILKILK